MGVLSDAKVLFDLLNAAGSWLQKAQKQARKDRDRRAAQVLHDAFVVVAGMHAYDNAFRPLLGQLLAFSIEWDDERRRRLSEQSRTAFDTSNILPHIRQARQGLLGWEGAGGEAVARLVELLEKFGEEVVSPIWAAKSIGSGREEILRKLEYGREPKEAEDVHAWARSVGAALNHELLAEADDAFGGVRHAILAKHDLPDPGYAVSLA